MGLLNGILGEEVETLLMKVLKRADKASIPDMVEFDSAFKVGDKFTMEYDWCRRIPCMNGYKPEWHKDIAEITVVDMVCNMLINPNEVWLRLSSDNETFRKKCGSEAFDAPEKQVLERMAA